MHASIHASSASVAFYTLVYATQLSMLAVLTLSLYTHVSITDTIATLAHSSYRADSSSFKNNFKQGFITVLVHGLAYMLLTIAALTMYNAIEQYSSGNHAAGLTMLMTTGLLTLAAHAIVSLLLTAAHQHARS